MEVFEIVTMLHTLRHVYGFQKPTTKPSRKTVPLNDTKESIWNLFVPGIENCQLKLLGKLKTIYFIVYTTSLFFWPWKVLVVHTKKNNSKTGSDLLFH